MAIEHRKPVVLTIEHGQTLASIPQSYASAFAGGGAIAQSRSVINHTDFEHCAPSAAFYAN
jgi:hypothetical protein